MNKTLIINNNDNVGVALSNLKKGQIYNGVKLLEDIPQGHKFALIDIKIKTNVIKYGYPIGHASKNILKGSHVHSHNLITNLSGELKYQYHQKFNDVKSFKETQKIKVYKRSNGEYGIRNNLMIIPLVGCVNRQAELIKNNIEKKINKKYCDSVIVATHPYGCSQLGDDHLNTVNVLKSLVTHPNNGGVLVVALGCENNQLELFIKALGKYDSKRVRFIKCQSVSDEIKEGTKLCLELYENMKKDKRIEKPLSVITCGLKCGGSDGLSGITANPLVGRFSDYLIFNGGSAILSEVPEMFGAEQVLMERASDKNIFNKEVKLINNFKNYYKSHNQVCYENPSPGNKQGGITTLEEKSLGCVQKSGLSKVSDVLNVGDSVSKKGLNLLYGPGNDMVACTNIVCSHAQLILFTTGRGTPFGSVVPTVKISTNTKLFKSKQNWIDFNAGAIVDGINYDAVTKDFIKTIIKIINGEKTKNEINGFEEIAIFKDGVTL